MISRLLIGYRKKKIVHAMLKIGLSIMMSAYSWIVLKTTF